WTPGTGSASRTERACSSARALAKRAQDNSRHEFVAGAADAQEVAGARRIDLEVAAQARDEIVDGACGRVCAELPDLLEKLLAADDAARVLDEVAHHVELEAGHLERLAIDHDVVRVEVDHRAAEGDAARARRRLLV